MLYTKKGITDEVLDNNLIASIKSAIIGEIDNTRSKKNFYVQRSVYSSYDWHDMATNIEQMKDNGKYEVLNPVELIAADIYQSIKGIADTNIYTTESIIQIIQDGKNVSIPMIVEEEVKIGEKEYEINPNEIEFIFEDPVYPYVRYNYSSGYTYNIYYIVYEIEECDVRYLVSEHIINPGKGCDLITRTYHEAFLLLKEAEVYQEEMMKEYILKYGRESSGYKVEVCDIRQIEKEIWYQKNMNFISLAEKLSLSKEDMEKYRYMSGYDALKALQAAYYNKLSENEQIAVDINVYRRFEPHVPKEYQKECTNAISSNCFTRKMFDKALILAYVNAKSQKEYDSIRKSLDDYESRIIELTCHIARQHRGKGYTVVSKSGDIKYYKSGYGISLWEESKIPENKYHGKFQYNFGTALVCFTDYDPDIFVDEFPSEEQVDEWEEAYKKANDMNMVLNCFELR